MREKRLLRLTQIDCANSLQSRLLFSIQERLSIDYSMSTAYRCWKKIRVARELLKDELRSSKMVVSVKTLAFKSRTFHLRIQTKRLAFFPSLITPIITKTQQHVNIRRTRRTSSHCETHTVRSHSKPPAALAHPLTALVQTRARLFPSRPRCRMPTHHEVVPTLPTRPPWNERRRVPHAEQELPSMSHGQQPHGA